MQTDNQARNLFITCHSYREAAILVDPVEQMIQREGIPVVVVSYGVTEKHNGFVVVEYYRPLPVEVLNALRAEPTIIDFVIYNMPSLQQEIQAEQKALIQAATIESSEENERKPLLPPEPPAEYRLLNTPAPLLTVYDERWIGRAVGSEGMGYLIYESLRCCLFLPIDEAIVVLAIMSEESRSWMEEVHPQVSERHQQLVAGMRAYWHMLAREEGGPQ